MTYFKVLTEELKSVGLFGAKPLKYEIGEWTYPLEPLSSHHLKGGGLWVVKKRSDAFAIKRRLLKEKGMATRIFSCEIGKVLFETFYRAKTDKVKLLEEIQYLIRNSRGLIICEPWLDLIFEGKKTWELRSRNTHIRGSIYLIRSGSGLIIGQADLVRVVRLPEKEMSGHYKKHGERRNNFGFSNKIIYAWVLKNAKRFKKPKPYIHPMGAVIWVRLDSRSKNHKS